MTRAATNARVVRRAVGTSGHVALATSAVCAGYLGALTVTAWYGRIRGRHRTDVSRPPSTRFAVLVPAHDEERLIAGTVKQLLATDYPPDLVEVHVLADHCRDATADLATAAGATVHVPATEGGKGAALQWAIDTLPAAGPIDAFLIVDADTQVDAGALRVLDARIVAGASAVQCHYRVSDPDLSPASALRAAALAVRHYLRPLARTSIGGSAGLFGNGMAFTADAAGRQRWSNHLTEDIEYHVDLLADGRRVDFAADAVVSAEMPDTLEASVTQNERWESGRIDILRRSWRGLLAPGPRRVTRADVLVDLLQPPFSILAALTAAGLIATAPWRRHRRAWLLLGVGSLVTQVIYLGSGLVLVRAPRAVYRALLHAPSFVLWKVRLWLRVVGGSGSSEWVRTARNAERSA